MSNLDSDLRSSDLWTILPLLTLFLFSEHTSVSLRAETGRLSLTRASWTCRRLEGWGGNRLGMFLCLSLQRACFCWRRISPKACWCLESSLPQGEADAANCKISAGLWGFVNYWVDNKRKAFLPSIHVFTEFVWQEIFYFISWFF